MPAQMQVRTLARRAIRRWERRHPVLSREDIDASLRELGPIKAEVILVHSSLSWCGYIAGGAQTVVDALTAWAASADLMMPAFAYCYPNENGKTPVFNRSRSPSQVGAITEHFRHLRGVSRSGHPSHSVACSGKHAEMLCSGHENCTTPCGAGTPFERLTQMNSAVLMFGVRLDAYTLFHTAEDAADAHYLYEPVPTSFLVEEGEGLQTVTCKRQIAGGRRFEAMENWFDNRSLLRRSRLGRGELLLVTDAAAAHGALVEALRRSPTLLLRKWLPLQNKIHYRAA